MTYIDCVQGSEEWHQARLGKITASRVHDILPGRNGYKAARKNYMTQLICDILTGQVWQVDEQESYHSKEMDYGSEAEYLARLEYEKRTGEFVTEVGFVIHEKYNYMGTSPDGLVLLSKKGIEIKCPNTAQHIGIIVQDVDSETESKIKPCYYTQIQFNMMCTGFRKWDFVSFDNRRLSKGLQLFIKPIIIDMEYCQMIEKEVQKFWNELNNKLIALKAYQEKWEA